MSEKKIHIVSFNIPYPANYGGVIDVYYKIKMLHQYGIKIILHCFEYGRERSEKLEKLCEVVYYYKRDESISKVFSLKPYIVISRKTESLINVLLKDNYPILFEGLHCCYYLNDKRLKNRVRIYRESNIEHDYYYYLFKAESRLFKKLYFLIESWKLKLFERIVAHSSFILVVSKSDYQYFRRKYTNKVVYLPSFHSNETFNSMNGKGKYILYHGNLSVPENELVAKYLIEKIFPKIQVPAIVAGLNPSPELLELVKKRSENIQLIENPSDSKMGELIRNAQINLLLTFQPTGLKLKLLNVLYNGRFCIANSEMLEGTGLGELCVVVEDKDIVEKVKSFFDKEFELNELEKRKLLLDEFSNKKNVEKLIALAFGTTAGS